MARWGKPTTVQPVTWIEGNLRGLRSEQVSGAEEQHLSDGANPLSVMDEACRGMCMSVGIASTTPHAPFLEAHMQSHLRVVAVQHRRSVGCSGPHDREAHVRVE